MTIDLKVTDRINFGKKYTKTKSDVKNSMNKSSVC